VALPPTEKRFPARGKMSRPLAPVRPPLVARAITHELTLCTRALRGGPLFPGSSTTPPLVWRDRR
jgi:hypothetical protein